MLEACYFVEGMKNDFNLHCACAHGCFAIAELLINKGVDVTKIISTPKAMNLDLSRLHPKLEMKERFILPQKMEIWKLCNS